MALLTSLDPSAAEIISKIYRPILIQFILSGKSVKTPIIVFLGFLWCVHNGPLRIRIFHRQNVTIDVNVSTVLDDGMGSVAPTSSVLLMTTIESWSVSESEQGVANSVIKRLSNLFHCVSCSKWSNVKEGVGSATPAIENIVLQNSILLDILGDHWLSYSFELLLWVFVWSHQEHDGLTDTPVGIVTKIDDCRDIAFQLFFKLTLFFQGLIKILIMTMKPGYWSAGLHTELLNLMPFYTNFRNMKTLSICNCSNSIMVLKIHFKSSFLQLWKEPLGRSTVSASRIIDNAGRLHYICLHKHHVFFHQEDALIPPFERQTGKNKRLRDRNTESPIKLSKFPIKWFITTQSQYCTTWNNWLLFFSLKFRMDICLSALIDQYHEYKATEWVLSPSCTLRHLWGKISRANGLAGTSKIFPKGTNLNHTIQLVLADLGLPNLSHCNAVHPKMYSQKKRWPWSLGLVGLASLLRIPVSALVR